VPEKTGLKSHCLFNFFLLQLNSIIHTSSYPGSIKKGLRPSLIADLQPPWEMKEGKQMGSTKQVSQEHFCLEETKNM